MKKLFVIVLASLLLACGSDDEPKKYENIAGNWVIDHADIQADFIIEEAFNFGDNLYLVSTGDFSLQETGGPVHEFDIFGSSSDVFEVSSLSFASLTIYDTDNEDNYLILEDCVINSAFSKITAGSYSYNIDGVQFSEGLTLSVSRK